MKLRQQRPPQQDFPPAEDDIITDQGDQDEPVLDISDDWHTGIPFEPLEDQVPHAEIIQQIVQALTAEIKHEQLRLAQTGKNSIRVSTNLSGSTQFRRYDMTASMGALQVLWEKPYRGDTVFTNLDDTDSVWLADAPGLNVRGPNTVEIKAGAARTIRTREQLFAIVESATVTSFDIQEEFDS